MNAERFYIGTAILNRSGIHEKNTVGMFVNTAPILIELDSNGSFRENLDAIKAKSFGVFRHQRFNYNDVLSAIRSECGYDGKLYDVVLSYQNATVIGENVETTWYPSGAQIESLQVHINDRDSDGIYHIQYDYRTDKFSEAEIDSMHRHIINLLSDAIREDAKPIFSLEMLSADEKHKLLDEFNDTAVDYPRDKCVHQLFEEQAERTPDKIAVIACDKTLTYRELNELANQIAHSLFERGVKPGDIVAFKLPRRSYLIASMLGILKVGAAYMPIDPDYPEDRISYMIEDSKAIFLITDNNISDLINLNIPYSNLELKVNSALPCYCIYTSGSTGNPKGTVLSHRNVLNYLSSNAKNPVVNYVCNSHYSSVVSVTTVGFDIFLTESLMPLVNSITIILANEKRARIQSELNSLILSTTADVLQTTPTKMRSLLLNPNECDYIKTLKAIILGGEALDRTLIDVLKQISFARIFNIYGPSETTVWSTNADVPSNGEITIGRPIANTKIYIVDCKMQPVPIGVTGELCIAGDGVGMGYLNRPELTAEKFIDNPFGVGKLYKTGDLAYWREDGNIVYVGRNDFQVKVRGLRIELGEIENAIQSFHGIAQAVVTVRKNDDGRQLICAFYTGQEVSPRTIRDELSQRLPRYMLPHSFTHLSAMPLTSSGKVNRRALPDVDVEALSSENEYVKPEGEVELNVAAAMEKVLNCSPIGRNDDFFDLGGDSLKAIELISVLEQSGFQADVRTLFEHPTVREFAYYSSRKETVKQNALEFCGEVPASPAQERIYTAQAIHGGTAYNVPLAFKVKALDPQQLQIAVQALVNRHEILCAHFEERNSQILQIIDASIKIKICVEQMASDNISDFIRPFDLSKAPLMRVGYYGDVVVMDFHHIIADGASIPVILRELNELYMGRRLMDTPIPYRLVPVKKNNLSESESYWLSIFSGELPILDLNTDHKRGATQSFAGAALYDEISIDLHRKILHMSHRLGATPYVFYIGGFFVLLSKFSGDQDMIVGTPMSGRNADNLNSIGMFVNTVALRGRPESDKKIADFLSEIKKTVIEAIAYQDYPYGDLVKKLGINVPGRNPLFDVMFAYQSEDFMEIKFGDDTVEMLPVPTVASKYDITFNLMPSKCGVTVMVEYCADLFCESTIRRLFNGYKLVLEQMLKTQSAIKDISAITEQEKNALLFEFNNTTVDYPLDKCVHQLFEEQVLRTPDKPAIIACDRTLTYRELNEQSNSIAYALIEKGVKPGNIVAIMLPKRSYLLSAMFGVLKAGAAYLPIDLSLPKERINFILKDSNATFIINENDILSLVTFSKIEKSTPRISGNSACYCIYTSGTTGEPKGIILSHRNAINYIYGIANSLGIGKYNSIASIASVGFDIFVTETLFPMLHGMTVFLADEEEAVLPTKIRDFVTEHNADIIQAPPTKIGLLISCLDFQDSIPLKAILIGGEVPDGTLIARIRSITSAHIFNVYGPSETTVGVTASELTSNLDISIGKPFGNVRIYILDNEMQLVPIGVTGEICIAGDSVGMGYINRPELTAEKFVSNPFGTGKLYKTGDLAYWREDGNITYVGRNDFQVKIHGLRIELGEIESAIQSIPGINQAVATVRKSTKERQFICAFYTGMEYNARTIREELSKKLPKYMLPHSLTHLNTLPMTVSGKVNRSALSEVNLDEDFAKTEYVAPVGEIETHIATLMEDILDYSPVGRDNDFFDLGGDSLKVIELVTAAHIDGIYFEIQDLYKFPTVRQLTEHIGQVDDFENPVQLYAYPELSKLLEKNHTEYITTPDKTEVGNLLLTGATGYLGIHILAEYLKKEQGTAYCLVRGENKEGSRERLSKLLSYYFGDKYEYSDRIVVLCADLKKEYFGLSAEEYNFLVSAVDTVINCAASVKHYGSYKFFHEENVDTVEKIIKFAMASGARLIHISTLSVAGNRLINSSCNAEVSFDESKLYVGQLMDSPYIRSKFEAECMVLSAIKEGLKANILRMGNLTNRYIDGAFQINYNSNAFLNRMMAILQLGMLPDYISEISLDFTPIDEAARAVMEIAQHFNPEHTVFHINSTSTTKLEKLCTFTAQLGYPVRFVPAQEFIKALRKSIEDSTRKHIFDAFIGDLDSNNKLNYESNIHTESSFTEKYLRRLGFEWSELEIDYFKKYIEYMKSIGYLK